MPRRVSPGQHYLSNPLVRDSATVNDLLRMREAFTGNELGARTQRPSLAALTPCEILVRSPADLDAGSIVEIGDYYLDEMDAANLWFEGSNSSSSSEQIAVIRYPVKSGELVRAILDGACMARVNVTNTSHRYATIGSAKFTSGLSGLVWIMTTPETTGDQLLPIRFFNPFNVRIAVLDGDLAHGGSATASVYTANAGTESDSGENVTVYDFDHIGSGKEIVSGTKVIIANIQGFWYVINAAACATTIA